MENNSDYPKSSCSCYRRQPSIYTQPEGNPSNMSVVNCIDPDISSFTLNSSIQPNNQKGYELLNPEVLEEQYSKNFQKIQCNLGSNCQTAYMDSDPRLLSAIRAEYLPLNAPPLQSSIDYRTVDSDNKLNNYGKHYKDYSDINAGQLVYYINNELAEPFYRPNFVTSANTISKVEKDPMGKLYPSYTREPLKDPDHLNTTKKYYDGCLSWIQDSTSHREDLMSKQMEKFNRHRWEPRWIQ